MLILWTRFACFACYIHLFCCIWSVNRWWWSLVLLLPNFFWTCTILTKYTCRVLTYLHHFDILNPPSFWHLCIVLTNLHHLNTEFHEKSAQIIFVVCKGTSGDCGQSKQSEFTRPRAILRYATEIDIVIITLSFCSSSSSLRSIFGK